MTGNFLARFVYVFAFCGGLLHLVNSAAGLIVPLQMRPLHLAFVAALAIAADKNKRRVNLILNALIILFAFLSCAYIGVNYEEIAKNAGYVTDKIVFCGSMAIAVILIVAWRTVGRALSIVAGCFLLYALLGQHIPGMMGHRGYSFGRVVNFLYTNANGIFGTPIDTSARYLVLFMVMAEYIEKSGAGKLFMAIADFIAKHTRGGAAKSSVVGSALFGSISGTPIANVMVTGAFTIPMMKKSGFTPAFAAGVEATASTGGLIMPPVMGAGAFIMAELLGISYGAVMEAAVIPAILYYISLYIAVDFFAAKRNIANVVEMDNKEIFQRLKLYIHTAVPLAFFIVSVVTGYSVFRSAIIAIAATPFIAALRKETRMTPSDILDGIADGMKKTVGLGAATACAGIIVGVISLTGFGFSFSALLGYFAQIPVVALLITMLICIVMGMGMPAVASYLITATIAAPALIEIGFWPIAVHMFIFYFSAFSSVTPPVALASYTAAGLAECDPWETGFEAFKLSLVAFLCPFMFVFAPALLGESSLTDLALLLPTAVCGVFSFVCGIQGYFGSTVRNPLLRLALVIGGLLMIDPGLVTDLMGIAILAGAYFANKALQKRQKK
ncbi:MAG: TRAP transporter fused permease subunit [Acidaminococcales bacterium]|jgi:TRAP transporter 4TM/12TM fusion protein|nr:TRAP transporter fused permease subunit [Acidaminococcales bacterium]